MAKHLAAATWQTCDKDWNSDMGVLLVPVGSQGQGTIDDALVQRVLQPAPEEAGVDDLTHPRRPGTSDKMLVGMMVGPPCLNKPGKISVHQWPSLPSGSALWPGGVVQDSHQPD